VKYLRNFGQEFKKNKALFSMLAPAFILTVVLSYIPMVGLILAFKNFNYGKGIFGSKFNGIENFRFLFASGKGWQITKNTILYNLLNLVTSQAIAILLSIFITEIRAKYYKKVTQSLIFLPYFISWVLVGIFVFAIFNYETGLLNNLRKAAGAEPYNIYAVPGIWPFLICAFNAWKWSGYNSVIYIAAITGVDQEIYEAAAIDGANIFQRIRHIMLPCIRPTVITMLLLQVGRILRGDFEMFYQIVGNNGQLFDVTDVIDTYVFRSLMTNANIGMTTAAALYQSVVCFVVIVLVNAIVKRIDADYALF